MSIYRVAAFQAIKRGWFNKIESIAIHYDWNIAFDGKSTGNRHLSRTVRLVKYLWEKVHSSDDSENEPVLRSELDFAVAGALLHDIGLVEGNPDHCRNGKIIADSLLMDIDITKEIKQRILHCIEAHDGEIQAETMEAKLVHDADTIDKLGPLGALRHIWKLCLLGEPGLDPNKLLKIVPEHLNERFDKLYLDESRKLAADLIDTQRRLFAEPERFGRLVDFINESARSGLDVDKMLPALFEKLNLEPELQEVILKQIKLEFIEV